MILFARHNLLKDPPFAHLDLVSCRNLMIYLGPSARSSAPSRSLLRPSARRLPVSRVVGDRDGTRDFFVPVDRDAHLFRSRAVTSRVTLPSPTLFLPDASPRVHPRCAPRRDAPPSAFHSRTCTIGCSEGYAPASLVINEEHDIVHVTEHATSYLQFAAEPDAQSAQSYSPRAAAGIAHRLVPGGTGPHTREVGRSRRSAR